MSIDGNSSKSNYMKAKIAALRLECWKKREMRNIKITHNFNMTYIEGEIRSARIFLSRINRHCGNCETAIKTTGKENKLLRMKLRSNPKMVFGNYDDLGGLTSKLLRDKYRLQFDIDYTIYRKNRKKPMTWPKV